MVLRSPIWALYHQIIDVMWDGIQTSITELRQAKMHVMAERRKI